MQAAPGTSFPSNASFDGLTKFSLWLAICVPVALILFSASPFGPNFIYVMLGIPALLLLGVLAGATAVFAAARNLLRRKFLPAAILAIPVLATAAAACNPFAFVRLCNHLGDYVHLAVMQRSYEQRALARQPTPPRLVVFDRGGMIWFSTGIVYDEADETALPANRQSAAWKARAANTELTCGYEATHLWEHFYSAGIHR